MKKLKYRYFKCSAKKKKNKCIIIKILFAIIFILILWKLYHWIDYSNNYSIDFLIKMGLNIIKIAY